MEATPTTTCTIYRGTDTGDWGDPRDTDSIAGLNIPISIMEQSRYVMPQGSTTPIVVRTLTGRVGGHVDIRDDDRILDDQTDLIYMVVSVSQPGSPVHAPDLRLDLRRIGPQTKNPI